MTPFATLVDRLEAALDADAQMRLLADWLTGTPDPDRGAALGLLLGDISVARASPAAIRALASRLDPVLLAISLETTGDLAEAVALLWPGPSQQGEDAPRLAEIVAALSPKADRASFVVQLAALLDRLEPGARVALLRLATGRLAGLIAAPVAQGAIALASGAALREVELIWHAAAAPYAALFAWIAGGPRPAPAARAAFRPLAVVVRHAEDAPPASDNRVAEPAWDGLRVLAVAEAETRRLFSRRGVDLGGRFPELLDVLEGDVALEGMVVVRGTDGRLSRAALETRLKRAPARRAAPGTLPATLMVHDALRLDGEDLRVLPFHERRRRLEDLFAAIDSPRLALSPSEAAGGPSALRVLRRDARTLGASGVVLKRLDAAYGDAAGWAEVRCEPLRLMGALLYVEYGRNGLEATVGAWDRDRFTPLAKAPVESERDALRIADYAAESRADRFGPVVQVQADRRAALIVEIAFDRIERAPRRKSGVALHGVRIVRLRPEASPLDAVELDDVRRLLA